LKQQTSREDDVEDTRSENASAVAMAYHLIDIHTLSIIMHKKIKRIAAAEERAQ
jgi:hypothetical protein